MLVVIVRTLARGYPYRLPSVLWHCWFGGRKGIRPVKNFSSEVLAWLSVCREVQTFIWPSWCRCHSLSLAPIKSRLVLPFWYRLTWVGPDNGPLNGCVCNPYRLLQLGYIAHPMPPEALCSQNLNLPICVCMLAYLVVWRHSPTVLLSTFSLYLHWMLTCGKRLVSYDQLWAASLIGWNAVTWHSSLSNDDRAVDRALL